jgi:hypothetical protein
MHKLYGDRLQVFLDWYQQEHDWRKLHLSQQVDRELLMNFYQQKKWFNGVHKFINKEFHNPIDLAQEDIVLLRKELWLKKYVPFDVLLKLVFRDRGNGNEKLMNGSYEEEMVFLKWNAT